MVNAGNTKLFVRKTSWELVHHRCYETRQQAISEITEYIEIFDNRQRRHSRLGYLASAVFAKQFYQQQEAA